jgi:hypothetical protein
MDTLKSLITNAATDVYISQMPERFTVADLGCSSGPNALCLVEAIVGSIGRVCGRRSSQPPPEFSVLLNDLPTNDFNTIFFSLPEFTDRLKAAAGSDEWGRPMVFLSGVPGSFYGRLFPRRSVHFICSCSSLHWLSQVPPGLFDEAGRPVNKGKMYISSTSPPAVPLAYLRQFQLDFGLFLKSRAAEVVPGGRMVLAMLGRQTEGYIDRRTTFLWELLSESFAALVSQVSYLLARRSWRSIGSELLITDRIVVCRGWWSRIRWTRTTCRSTRRRSGRWRRRCGGRGRSGWTACRRTRSA